jgi:hypothetical protein
VPLMRTGRKWVCEGVEEQIQRPRQWQPRQRWRWRPQFWRWSRCRSQEEEAAAAAVAVAVVADDAGEGEVAVAVASALPDRAVPHWEKAKDGGVPMRPATTAHRSSTLEKRRKQTRRRK